MYSHFPSVSPPKLPTGRRFLPQILMAIFILYSFLLFVRMFGSAELSSSQSSSSSSVIRQKLGANNETLGFERIFALSPRDIDPDFAWRPDGMLLAAERTGLTIDIIRPEPPLAWLVEAMGDRNMYSSSMEGDTYHLRTKPAAALAWLGHLEILKLATQHTTTLILEDDADWDVDIKKQMSLLAPAIRNLTNTPPATSDNDTTATPYGTDWDVLWLGHCGNNVWDDLPHVLYTDTTVPPVITSFEEKVQASATTKQRYAYISDGPLCSWAYAVNRHSARKMLDLPSHGTMIAYDIWLGVQCKEGVLKCIAVNPELFHTHDPAGRLKSLIDGVSSDVAKHARTRNILHSARCNINTAGGDLVSCL